MVFMVGKLFLNEFVDANISNADHFLEDKYFRKRRFLV